MPILSLLLLFQINLLNSQNLVFGSPRSPCPNIFQYINDESLGNTKYQKTKGIIVFDYSIPIFLVVKLFLPVAVKHYEGEIGLAENISVLLHKLQFDALDKFQYNLLFDNSFPVPEITSITVNNRVICWSNPATTPSYTNMVWRHNLKGSTRAGPYGTIVYDLKYDVKKDFLWHISSVSNFPYPSNTIPIPYHMPILQNADPIEKHNCKSIGEYGNHNYRLNYSAVSNDPLENFHHTTTPKKKPMNYWTTKAPKEINSETFNKTQDSSHIFPVNNAKKPASKECGIIKEIDSLDGDGPPSNSSFWPWMVPLYKATDLGVQYFCSGTLVSDQYIVTAAHFVKPSKNYMLIANDLVAYVGRYNIWNWDAIGWQSRTISEVYIHPDYNPYEKEANLALMKLERRVAFTSYARPACIWTDKEDQNVVGNEGYIFGWNKDKKRHENLGEPGVVTMPVVSEGKCTGSKLDIRLLTFSRTICTEYQNGQCIGDCSGLFLRGLDSAGNIRWYLRGMVIPETEATITCGISGNIMFTDITKYLSWLKEFISL